MARHSQFGPGALALSLVLGLSVGTVQAGDTFTDGTQAAGLDFTHFNGIVHRDLKPDNIMVGEFGEVIVPGPATTLHVPTAGATAIFPTNVVLFIGRHSDCGGPALAAACAGLNDVTTT